MDNPVLAICYDFDHTLTTTDMQAQGFIQDLGYKNIRDFWNTSDEFCRIHNMDANSGYMYKMLLEAKAHNKPLTKTMLKNYGKRLTLFPAVEDWFPRIDKIAAERGVEIQHYIISSGLKEMIEGTSIAKFFKKIYACCYLYNEHNEAIWPAQTVNYTNKTQFLFRIEKGFFDVSDDRVNDYVDTKDLNIPFRNMVYIGDSATDIPCMQLMNKRGGHSIGVYSPTTGDKEKICHLFKDGRIRYIVPADYSPASPMEKLLTLIIEKTAAYEKLENFYQASAEEAENYLKDRS